MSFESDWMREIGTGRNLLKKEVKDPHSAYFVFDLKIGLERRGRGQAVLLLCEDKDLGRLMKTIGRVINNKLSG